MNRRDFIASAAVTTAAATTLPACGRAPERPPGVPLGFLARFARSE